MADPFNLEILLDRGDDIFNLFNKINCNIVLSFVFPMKKTPVFV
jgi:hypothetical protein